MSKAAELAALIGSQTALSNRNLIINGAMQVAQRGTSFTGVGGTNAVYTVDRFNMQNNGTAGRVTVTQESVTDLPGFANALKLDVTTADTSIAAAEYFGIQTRLEGNSLQQLQKGTSSAKAVTLSFYAKGTAKTYVAELEDNNSRVNGQKFTVSTSWQKFTLTYTGDTSGVIADDNAAGLNLHFWLHGGSNFTSGTFTSNTWASTVQANRMPGVGSIFSSTDNELFITGVQMELGEQATPFEHRSFGDELRRCQRYYYKISGDANLDFGVGICTTTTLAAVNCPYAVPMREKPTALEQSGTATHYDVLVDNGVVIANAVPVFQRATTVSGTVGHGVASGLTAGEATIMRSRDNDAFLAWSAEL